MTPREQQLVYRQAAVREATPVELVVMLYDILAKDLQDAIAAMAAGDIEERSARLKHALLALHQLQSATDAKEGEIAQGLSRLYSTMRGKIMEAQIKQAAGLLIEQLNLILQLRTAWAKARSCAAPEATTVPSGAPIAGLGDVFQGQESGTSSWKA